MKTLAMMKMEKNFIAVIEKKCPRKPYEEFYVLPILERLSEEFQELCDAINEKRVEDAKWECADISNLIDYLFERLSSNPQEMSKNKEQPT